jgi:uncharacterized protein (DUF4415 family)
MKPGTTAIPCDPAAAQAAAPEAAMSDVDSPQTATADRAGATPIQGDDAAATAAKLRRRRGPQKAPTKVLTALRLSPEVIAFFKAAGKGWQTRIDEALRDHVRTHSERPCT